MRQSGSGDTWVDDEEWEDDTANQTELVNHAQNMQMLIKQRICNL